MRYERKYKIEDCSISTLQQSVKMHPAGFRKIFPDRIVNNIYFDTANFTCFNDNVAGVPQRKKYRIRWYGKEQLSLIKSPQLEIKIKDNQLGTKETSDLPAFSFLNLEEVIQAVRRKDPTGTPLNPVLYNSYKRSYFGTSDGRFRITLDDQLFYSHPAHSKGMRYEDKAVILELKYEANMDNKTDLIMQYLPFRQTKSSKYVTGVNFVFGG